MKQKKFVSCVVYLHNSEKEITDFMNMLYSVLNANFEKYEMICVDDASDDGTVEALQNFVSKVDSQAPISLVSMSYYQGQEAAMNAGRDLAVGDFVYEFDSIFMDYDESLIMDLYQKTLEGYDIVSAAPKNNISFSSKMFYFFYNLANKSKNKLKQERFRIISRRAVNRVNQMNAYVPYRKAMYVNCGLQMASVPYQSSAKSKESRSAQEKSSRSDLAFDSFIIFTNILEKISLGLCMFFLLVMIVMAIYVVYSVFSTVRPVEGWMSTIGLMAFGFFGLFSLMTLVLKYLSVIINLIFKKQRYVISGVEKLTK